MSNKNLRDRISSRPVAATRLPSRKRRHSTVSGAGFSSMRRGLLVGAGASALALAAFGVMVHSNRPQTAPNVPRKLRVVLIDSSDRNTAVQDRLISRIVEQTTVQDLGEGDRLILLGLSADQNEPLEERFNQISPARATDESPWSANLDELEAAWRREFLDVYVKEARDLREVLEKKQTPFLEGMMQISSILQQYEADRKSVIIVSDALQHISGGLSAYTRATSRSVLAMPDSLAGFYAPSFNGAHVKLVHIKRNATRELQGSEHRVWIDKIFKDHGADLEYIDLS